MEKNITIVDIAKKTGLSVATVSRALNGHPSVKRRDEKKSRGYSRKTWLSGKLSGQESRNIIW